MMICERFVPGLQNFCLTLIFHSVAAFRWSAMSSPVWTIAWYLTRFRGAIGQMVFLALAFTLVDIEIGYSARGSR